MREQVAFKQGYFKNASNVEGSYVYQNVGSPVSRPKSSKNDFNNCASADRSAYLQKGIHWRGMCVTHDIDKSYPQGKPVSEIL